MKISYPLTTTTCLFLLMSAIGNAENIQQVAPPATPPKDMGAGMQHGMGGGMGMHHGMGGMMAGMTDEQKDQHLRSMQEHMLKMHDLSNQILAEKDAAKKEGLKKQQLDLMKAHHTQMMEHHQQIREKSSAK
jgi:hypothetical protein